MASELTAKDYKEDVHVDWCPGCGDFGILSAIQMTLADMGVPPHRTAVFSGIGCSGKTSQYVKAYGIHTLHGRVLPFATGAKVANPDLNVVAVGGDGDGYGIGAGHFLNAGRRNLDLAYVVFNNDVYGLTKGQASPTMELGAQTKSLPQPNINQGVNPLTTAISAGYTWVGRSYAFNVPHLKTMIRAAIDHEGAALLDVLQPCPTYNNLHDKDFYTPRVYDLAKEDPPYDGRVSDPTDAGEMSGKMTAATAKALEHGERIPIGVFWEVDLPTYEERIAQRIPTYPNTTPATTAFAEDDGAPTTDLTPFLKRFDVMA